MKITLKKMIIRVLLVISFILSGQQSSNAQKEVSPINEDSVYDFNKFKKDAEEKINENKKKIELLKSKKTEATKKKNKRFTKRIKMLERKTNKMKRKIEKYQSTKMSKWVLCKLNFSHDMKELGDALDNMSVEQYQLSQ